jgi:hypothetical protein
MAVIASTILTMARTALLNDPSGAIYPDAAMYPVMNLAYQQLQTRLAAMGLGPTKETFPAQTVTAGTVALGDGSGLPTNLLYPTEIGERAVGDTNPYKDMDEREWEPDIVIGTQLGFWTWREDEIKFPGATTNRQILIKGMKSLGSISAGNSAISVINCEAWLAQRTASIAALTVGNNASRAKALDNDLIGIWDDFKQGLVKRTQSIPVRRRRTRYRQD